MIRTNQVAVLRFVAENPGATVDTIARALRATYHLKIAVIRTMVYRFRKEGLLQEFAPRSPSCSYTITPTGRRVIEAWNTLNRSTPDGETAA